MKERIATNLLEKVKKSLNDLGITSYAIVFSTKDQSECLSDCDCTCKELAYYSAILNSSSINNINMNRGYDPPDSHSLNIVKD